MNFNLYKLYELMIIGIDGSRAFLAQRTGIEEYSYQVIKHLTKELRDCQVILYLRNNQEVDFDLPVNWKAKKMRLPYFFSQARFSLEFLFNPVDTLFIPAHVVPPIHPKNTIVVIHGLEYEFVNNAYSSWAKFYMSVVIKNSCRWAKKIIAVSNNTKRDLMKLYKVPEEKIGVIYEGYDSPVIASVAKQSRNDKPNELKNGIAAVAALTRNDGESKFLLFIGRLEERKNIVGIIKTFEILKEHYKIPHKLVLAGKFGYGEQEISRELENTNCANDIILPGYVGEKEKWELLKNADIFLFPTFYEGFGLPVLEAQSIGIPVVAGNNSSIREITTIPISPLLRRDVPQGQRGSNENENQPLSFDSSPQMGRGGLESVILVDPYNAEEIADAAYKLISDEKLRDDIIKKGHENVKRFSWAKCATEIAELLTK